MLVETLFVVKSQRIEYYLNILLLSRHVRSFSIEHDIFFNFFHIRLFLLLQNEKIHYVASYLLPFHLSMKLIVFSITIS